MKSGILIFCSALVLSALRADAALFVIGQVGTTGGANNWPGAEHPALALDGNPGTKYLNFAEFDTGYIYSAADGSAQTVTGISFATANDAPDRDPVSFVLYGSNTAVVSTDPGATFNTANFTLIAQGDLNLPGDRLTAIDPITFDNATAYNTYLLVFPTVKNPDGANSMQIGEARLLTANGPVPEGIVGGGQLIVPEPGTAALTALVAVGLVTRRRRGSL